MYDFYYWLQRELEKELSKIYKIYRIRVFNYVVNIWFLNNEDVIAISLDDMEKIYNHGKDMEELTSLIEAKYLLRIRK